MKKLLVAVALVASVTSVFAEKVRLGTAVVAGRAALTQAANKLGELSCNAMVAGFAQSALADQPETPTVYALTVDGETPDFSKVENPQKEPKLAKDVVAKVTVNGKAVNKLLKQQKDYSSVPEPVRQTLDVLASVMLQVRVNNKGVSLEMTAKSTAVSEFRKRYPVGTLPKDALAFAAKNCLLAMATAENVSNFTVLRDILAHVEREGVKLDGLTVDGTGNDVRLTLDLAQLAKTCQTQKQACDKIDCEKFLAAVTNLQQKVGFGAPAGKFALALKGYEGACTPAERFAATLPDVAAKPLCSQWSVSYYGLIKATLPTILAAKCGAAVDPQLKALAESLPPEPKGGVAAAAWLKDPNTCEAVIRISADEIRAFGLAVPGVMAYMMTAGGDDADDDESEDSDGDSKSDEKSDDKSSDAN